MYTPSVLAWRPALQDPKTTDERYEPTLGPDFPFQLLLHEVLATGALCHVLGAQGMLRALRAPGPGQNTWHT